MKVQKGLKPWIGALLGLILLVLCIGWLRALPETKVGQVIQAIGSIVLFGGILAAYLSEPAHRRKSRGEGVPIDQTYVSTTEAGMPYRVRLASELSHALERGELVLHYQPQIETKSGKIRGFEALLRWNHPRLGMVLPADFIPLAEETGLIVPIGEWVLYEACSRNRFIQEWGFVQSTMCVNISVAQLKKANFAESVLHILQQTGQLPSQLELELTESMLISSLDTSLCILNQLYAAGVKIALDDFGTGYSSLSYLSRLPLHVVKIDRSFIHDIGNVTRGRDLVESIIMLVQRMNIRVVAEGVETEDQLRCLRSFGCDCIQGYLVGRPMHDQALQRFLQTYIQERGMTAGPLI